MVGGFEADPLPVDPREQPASFATDDVPLDLGVLRTMAGRVAVEVPVVGSASVDEHRGGMFTMSPDGRFVAGPVAEMPGLWVASGCNGSGFSSSPAIGEALAEWITSGIAPPGMEARSTVPSGGRFWAGLASNNAPAPCPPGPGECPSLCGGPFSQQHRVERWDDSGGGAFRRLHAHSARSSRE